MTEADRTAADADPILGYTVNNYIVEKKLGEGGMGSVYLLRHTRLTNTFAALKILTAQGRDRQHLIDRFEQEAQVAAAIGSHRVVKPLDIGEFADGTPYIIMEYVAGRSLAEELHRHGAMSVARALRIAARLADTMAVAHDKGIVHRDLKPANVMLTKEGGKDDAVKLLDFGVARATGELKLAHTAENMIVGTPGYMSPEATTGGALDGRSDVFSLGVILFELLTSELPFDAPTAQAALVNVNIQPTPAVSRVRPAHLDTVPGSVERLIGWALEKKPEARCTMAELHARLTDILHGLHGGGDGHPATKMSMVAPVEPRTDPEPEPYTPAAPTTPLPPVAVPARISPLPAAATTPGRRPRSDEMETKVVVPTSRRGTSRRGWIFGAAAVLVIGVIGLVGFGMSGKPADPASGGTGSGSPPTVAAPPQAPPTPPIVTPILPGAPPLIVGTTPPTQPAVEPPRRPTSPKSSKVSPSGKLPPPPPVPVEQHPAPDPVTAAAGSTLPPTGAAAAVAKPATVTTPKSKSDDWDDPFTGGEPKPPRPATQKPPPRPRPASTTTTPSNPSPFFIPPTKKK